jgi:putative membrane protein
VIDRGMRPPAVQRWWLLACLAGVPLSAVGAVYPPNTWLQVGPVVIGVVLGWWALRRWPLSNASVAWVCAFILLHLLAARWTYSSVPYDAWGQAVFGFSIDAALGFERNMFDRLVHFASGLCFARALVEIGMRYAGLTRRMAIVVMVLAVLAIGALYEIFEWMLTIGMNAEAADRYNGQQGDMFDAPKDMALALLGCLTVLPWISAPQRPDRSLPGPSAS